MSYRTTLPKDRSGQRRTVHVDGFELRELPDGTKAVEIIGPAQGMEVQDCHAASFVTWERKEYVRMLDKNGNAIPEEGLALYRNHF